MATSGDLKSGDSLFCITPTYQQADPTSPPPPSHNINANQFFPQILTWKWKWLFTLYEVFCELQTIQNSLL